MMCSHSVVRVFAHLLFALIDLTGAKSSDPYSSLCLASIQFCLPGLSLKIIQDILSGILTA